MTGHDSNAEDPASLYRETITRHAREPTGYRRIIEATHRHEEYNPLCGDRVEIALQVADDRIEAAAFDGAACAICMASASMLCGLAPGRTVKALVQLGKDLQQALDEPVGAASAAMGTERDGEKDKKESRLKPLPHVPLPQELRALLGVRPYPSRVRCATLPWTAARRALFG